MSSTNLTVDDTSTDIVYSPDWLPQSADDQTAQRFFSSTYHAAQADGATANISFTGDLLAILTSKVNVILMCIDRLCDIPIWNEGTRSCRSKRPALVLHRLMLPVRRTTASYLIALSYSSQRSPAKHHSVSLYLSGNLTILADILSP